MLALDKKAVELPLWTLVLIALSIIILIVFFTFIQLGLVRIETGLQPIFNIT